MVQLAVDGVADRGRDHGAPALHAASFWLFTSAHRRRHRQPRTSPPVTGLLLDLRYTLRSLWKTGAIALIALVTIALGVGANTAMFSIVNAVVLSPLPYPKPDRIVALWPEKRWSLQMLSDVQQRVSSYTAISAYRTETFSILGGETPEAVVTGVVSPSHFDVLGVLPRIGRGFTAADAAEKAAQRAGRLRHVRTAPRRSARPDSGRAPGRRPRRRRTAERTDRATPGSRPASPRRRSGRRTRNTVHRRS